MSDVLRRNWISSSKKCVGGEKSGFLSDIFHEMIFREKRKVLKRKFFDENAFLKLFLILLNTHFAKMKVSRLSTRRMNETVWKRRLLRDFAQ